MIVVWAPAALQDRDAVIDYLEPFNPYAAIEVLQSLILAGDSLALFPYRGRIGMVAGTRELVAVSPYLIVYEIDSAADIVRILRLWHGARDRQGPTG